MTNLGADEVASVLLARVVQEIQNFAVSVTIHKGASAAEMWSHFVDHLTRSKGPPELSDLPVNERDAQ